MSSSGFTNAASSPTQHRNDCLECLMTGLTSIGIDPATNASVDFAAINSNDLCIAFAHAIEACLDGKSYIIGALSGDFIDLRARGAVITIEDFVSALVTLSSPK